jgi:hypothetical protein
MATYIKVDTDGNPLLEQSRRNMDAKRNAQAEREAFRRPLAQINAWTAAEKRRRLLRGRLPSRARREEPAPYIVVQRPRHNRLWLYPYVTGAAYEPNSVDRLRWNVRMWSGDASTSITYSSPSTEVQDTSFGAWLDFDTTPCQQSQQSVNIITLPIDRDSCVVVVAYATRIYTMHFATCPPGTPMPNLCMYASAINGTPDTKAYFVGKSSVREITLPSGVASLLSGPAAGTGAGQSSIYTYLGWLLTFGIYKFRYDNATLFGNGGTRERFASCKFTDISAISIPPIPNTDLSQALYYCTGLTTTNPAIYSLLLDYAAGDALVYEGDYNSVLYDFVGRKLLPRRSLSPSGVDDAFLLEYIGPQLQEGDVTYFPPVNGEDDPDYWTAAPGYIGTAQPLAEMPDDVPSYDLSKVYWLDWGIPGYNRRKLIELGFSTADLVP